MPDQGRGQRQRGELGQLLERQDPFEGIQEVHQVRVLPPDRQAAVGKPGIEGARINAAPRSEALQLNYTELKDALRAHDQAMRDVESRAIAVWTALAKAEPELAAEILHLFPTAEASANWATTPSEDLHGSPAQHVAEGRAADILSRVRKTAHGLVA